jgi:acyl carrier protein
MLDRVRAAMADALGISEDEICEDTSQETRGEWTSIRHMVLLVSLEDEFGLSFSIDEMTTMTSLPKVLSALVQRTGGNAR